MTSLANYDTYAGYYAQLLANQSPTSASFMREFYRLLFMYYQQNGLYDYLNLNLKNTKTKDSTLKPIRNPAWRVAEFYAAKLFPGSLPDALPIEAENELIVPEIHQIWNWSNFGSVKQRWARWFAIYGDWFIKIQTKGNPVSSIYMTLILPEYVTSLKTDERGFLTSIRIDVPLGDEDGDGNDDERVYTEDWNKGTQLVRTWTHKQGLDIKLSQLPNPDTMQTFEESHGENFIPIVYQPFRDDGGGRGSGAYSAQLDKIDEANRQATRLAQILFRYNRALWAATSSGTDASGRPLPPISMDGIAESDGSFKIGDDDILTLPSMSQLTALVPQLNYGDALEILEAQMNELSKDLPELAYYEIRTMRDLSGRAVKFLLDDMISRVVEVRGNAEQALGRAHAMALSIGQNLNVFSGLGEFEAGDFEHTFTKRSVLPEDIIELAQTVQTFASAGASIFAAAKAAGMSDEQANALSAVGFEFEEEVGGR